jgi:hypothetical protein
VKGADDGPFGSRCLVGRSVLAAQQPISNGGLHMLKVNQCKWFGLFVCIAALTAASVPAAAQQQKPNILFIMGDDIGWMQPSISESQFSSEKVHI